MHKFGRLEGLYDVTGESRKQMGIISSQIMKVDEKKDLYFIFESDNMAKSLGTKKCLIDSISFEN